MVMGSVPAMEDQESLITQDPPDFMIVVEDGEEELYEVRNEEDKPKQELEETLESLEAWGIGTMPREINNLGFSNSDIFDKEQEDAINNKTPSVTDIKIGFDDELEQFEEDQDWASTAMKVEKLQKDYLVKSK